jgi:very-short-patch-repair endonuclease
MKATEKSSVTVLGSPFRGSGGIRVVRFTNTGIVRNMGNVMKRIEEAIVTCSANQQ